MLNAVLSSGLWLSEHDVTHTVEILTYLYKT